MRFKLRCMTIVACVVFPVSIAVFLVYGFPLSMALQVAVLATVVGAIKGMLLMCAHDLVFCGRIRL